MPRELFLRMLAEQLGQDHPSVTLARIYCAVEIKACADAAYRAALGVSDGAGEIETARTVKRAVLARMFYVLTFILWHFHTCATNFGDP